MADGRRVKRNIKRLQRVKTWQLFILLIIMAFMAATFLRLNNIDMIRRRDAVLAADKTGDPSITQDRLYELQRYASSHMNSDTGVLYLEDQYKRDTQKAIDAASRDDNPNGNVLALADAACKQRYPGYSQAYVACVAEEQAKYPPSPELVQAATLPSAALYRYGFVSPLWTPDFAGFSVLVCLTLILMMIIRLVSLGALRLLLRRHYRDI